MTIATRILAVAILVAAGCTNGDSAGLTVASKDCVYVGGVPDDGPPISDVVCDPSDILPLPAGGLGLEIQDSHGTVLFDGRVYLDPDEIWTLPELGIEPFDPQRAAIDAELGTYLDPDTVRTTPVARMPLLPPKPEIPSGEATVDATAYENGAYAPARIVVWEHGNHVLTTTSGTPFRLTADTYDIAVVLDEVLDRPYQAYRLLVAPDQDVSIGAQFETGILEVRVMHDGQVAAGRADVVRHGQVVGTMGSCVARRLSAGTYDVAVHYRTETVLYQAVHLAPAQRRALTVHF